VTRLDDRGAQSAARLTEARSGAVGISARLVGLLAVLMFINYADRGSLSVAAPLLKDQLGVDAGQMGVLLSSFFWSYALAQPLAGIIAQKFEIRWVLASGLLVWAGATILCGLAGGFASLLALRLAMGLGESVIFPANARLLAEHAPNHQRGLANAVISMGMFLGPASGTLAGGLILARFGWHAVFLCLGAISLLWLGPWMVTPLPRSEPPPASAAAPESPGFAEILRQRSLWGISIGQFCYSYSPYLLLTWLPLFLVKAEHFSLTAMAWIGAAVPASQAAGAGLSGALSDRWIRRGGATTLVRKTFMLGGMAGCGVLLLMAAYASRSLVAPCLCGAALCSGAMSPMTFTVGQTLAGPQAAGRWMGVQNLVGNLAGISAPMITGFVVQTTGSFRPAFLIAASMSVIGVISWGLVVEKIEPVDWRRRARPGLAPLPERA
jgi:MFS family permease